MVASLYGVKQAKKAIWIFLEQEGGKLEGVSLELLDKGRQMADNANWSLVGLLIGKDVSEIADEAFSYGADVVVLADDPLLDVFTVDAYTQVTYDAIMEHKPSVFLLGATPNGRDLAGRLAVRVRTGLNADCTNLNLDKKRGILVSEVTGFGGGIAALIEMQNHRPQMATVRPGVFPPGEPDKKRKGKVIKLPIKLEADTIKTKVVERVVGEGVDLTQVPALVVGGRGIEGDFGLMRELAGLIGGDVGATRPPVDDGYIERERQIGQTGVVCRPKVSINCGVSGAFHFVVGVQESDIVISINTDQEAPIFDFTDYCIVGDVFEIIPALTAALSSVKELAHG
ncbi:MAG: electron transfer flavoprotein subunit alpha/FixB family protein [Chloroflexi bacterium]|nr:electron transfer flavoprotein subunit alpha/FixB family protein [Chloroflexota bacterium]